MFLDDLYIFTRLEIPSNCRDGFFFRSRYYEMIITCGDSYLSCYKNTEKMFSVRFKMFLRCGSTSPYEHLCDTGTPLIPYGKQIKSLYVLLGKKSVLYGSSKSQTFMLSLHLSDIHVIGRVCVLMFL